MNKLVLLDSFSECIGKTIADVKEDIGDREVTVITFKDETAIAFRATAGYEEASIVIEDELPKDY